MVKRSKKDLSKRMTLRRKFSIQRHVRNHNRDMRRAVKRNVESGLRMTQNKYAAEKAVLRLSNKDTSKKEFLQKTLEARHQIVEKKKLERKKKAKEFDPVVVVRRRAKEKAQEKLFALRKLQKATEDADFFLQLDKCLQHVDMLLIALDARCPLACYSSFLRTAAASHARPHWCIFTKTDLVPPEVLEKWFTYFQAHTDAVEVLSNDPTLLVARIQKHYGVNHKVRVLFAGLPNVGIETFCNAVTQTQAGSVSVHPSKELGPRGHIPYSQTISLLTLPRDAQIRSTAILGPEVLFRNWKFIVHNITDVELHAEDILRHFPAERIARHYRMALHPSSEATHHQPNPEPAQLLALLQKRRTLRDIREAARLILLDFHQGKLPWCCVPPAISSTKNEATSSTVFVREPWTVLDESFLHTLDYEISSKK